jgi:hypothetical protein
MKLETQNRLVVLALSTAFLSGAIGIGRVNPAFSPTKAEAVEEQIVEHMVVTWLTKTKSQKSVSDDFAQYVR